MIWMLALAGGGWQSRRPSLVRLSICSICGCLSYHQTLDSTRVPLLPVASSGQSFPTGMYGNLERYRSAGVLLQRCSELRVWLLQCPSAYSPLWGHDYGDR